MPCLRRMRFCDDIDAGLGVFAILAPENLCRSVNLTHICSGKMTHYLERRNGVYHFFFK